MNILQLISGTGVNGAIRHCYDLTCELARRGHRVLLAHKPDAWIAQQPFPAGVECMDTTLKRRPAELRRVAAAMKAHGIELIHSHNSSGHFFSTLLSLFYKYPRVATSHATFLQLHWRFCDRCIAPSEATARYLRRVNLIPRRRIDVIYNFIDVSRLRPSLSREEMRQALGIAEGDFLILTVGEVIPRKNQELLAAAVPEVARTGLRPVAFLAGKADEAYRRRIDERIRRDGSAAFVRLAGERSDIANLLTAADCFCLPSRSEVLPIALLEAMATGLPIVATDVGGVSELVRHGTDGFIVPSGDQPALVSALTSLAGDPALRRQMGAAGQERVRTTFTPEICVAQMEDCYRQACLRKSRSPNNTTRN